MTTIHEVLEVFGAVEYSIPKMGAWPSWRCTFGRHWLTILRADKSRQPVGLACGACRKAFGPIHDVDAPSIKEGGA